MGDFGQFGAIFGGLDMSGMGTEFLAFKGIFRGMLGRKPEYGVRILGHSKGIFRPPPYQEDPTHVQSIRQSLGRINEDCIMLEEVMRNLQAGAYTRPLFGAT